MISIVLLWLFLQAPGTILPGLEDSTQSYDMVEVPAGNEFFIQVVIRDKNGILVESTDIILPIPNEGDAYTLELMAGNQYFVTVLPIELTFMEKLQKNAWVVGSLGGIIALLLGAIKLIGIFISNKKEKEE